MTSNGKIIRVEICFGAAVNLPDSWERALDGLVSMVCAQYQREHPDRVMWPCEMGYAPTRAFFEGGDGPMFDDTTYVIGCHEREDLHGSNPHNPDREALQKAASEARKATKTAAKKWPLSMGVSRDTANPQVLCIAFDRVPTDDEIRALHEELK